MNIEMNIKMNEKDKKKIEKILNNAFDIPKHKIIYALNECSEQANPKIKNHPLMGKMVFSLMKGFGIVKDTETYEEMVSFIENDFNPKKYK
jgi:hypothetical protein